MKRQTTHLADGRELIYFDESDDAVRELVDRRQLPPMPPASQLRFDPLTDEWVAVAAHRQERIMLPPADQCPLCPSTPEHATEIPARDYDVVVFENRFPAFSARVDGVYPPLTPLTPDRPALGRCEVVCFTSDHNSSFAKLPPSRVRTVLAALADRTRELTALPGVEHVFCFENRGQDIGVTLHHPHGQIYAYPFLPPKARALLEASRRHAKRTGGNLVADMLAAERAARVRVIVENEHWTAYTPAAARWPFEIMLTPRRIAPDLPGLADDAADAFAPVYLDVLKRLDALFGIEMPYISAWRQAPSGPARQVSCLFLHLFSTRRGRSKLKYLAGSESAMGAFVNDIVPEQAARMLREAA